MTANTAAAANDHSTTTHANGTGYEPSTHFHLRDHPIDPSDRPRLKVAIIGAGFSGLMAGIRFDQRLRQQVDFEIFEKNDDVGGTWYENSYPGLCCDIPAHCYALTFEPNPNWSRFYAPGPEILEYLRGVKAKYKLERFIRYQHRLVHAQWDESEGMWTLKFDLLGKEGDKVDERIVKVHFVVSGMGGLNTWKWPDIEGLSDFKGRLLHSASYKTTAEDERGRKVAVIGSGSSSIQIVPALAPIAKHVDNYVRGQTWIAMPFASKQLLKRSPDGSNHVFTEEEKRLFSTDPEAYFAFRYELETELNRAHEVTLKGSKMQLGAVIAFRELMKQKLEKKPEIFEKIVPTFPVACRRLTPGPGYLEALIEDNVDFVSTGIKRVTEKGIEATDGTVREYDTIVCATGFDTSYRPRIPIIGRNGTNVQDIWSDIPTSYLSIAIGPDHPNWFVINGPNSAVGSGSLLVLFEKQVDYAVKVLQKLHRENLRTISAKQNSVQGWQDYVAAYFPRTVYSEKCRSWYKKGLEIGPVVALWPGSAVHASKALSHPRWEDYEYTPNEEEGREANPLAWLGNGWTSAELEGGETAYYLREVDQPPVPE